MGDIDSPEHVTERTLFTVYEEIVKRLSPTDADDLINDLLNMGVLFRQRA